MNEPVLLIEPSSGSHATGKLATKLKVRRVRDQGLLDAYKKHRRAVFISFGSDWTSLSGVAPLARAAQRLLSMRPIDEARRALAHALFDTVVAASEGVKLLARDELLEVMSAPNRKDYIIGGSAGGDPLVFFRGDLSRLIVPRSFFRASPASKPHFHDFEITDCGQAVEFGDYGASTHALLYAFDPEYRRRAKARAVEKDESFGGALRRLRTLRGLRQSDFGEVSREEIARIERGRVKKPHGATLEVIAKKLGVRPEKIATY
jgi:hypothetical protein